MTAAEIRHIFAYRWLEPFQASATESAHAAAAILGSAFSVSHWPAFRREVPVHSLYPGPFSRRRFLHGITLAGTAGLRAGTPGEPPRSHRLRRRGSGSCGFPSSGVFHSAWRAEDIRLLLRQANARADAGDYRQPRPATGARIARPGYAPIPQMTSGSISAFGIVIPFSRDRLSSHVLVQDNSAQTSAG